MTLKMADQERSDFYVVLPCPFAALTFVSGNGYEANFDRLVYD